MKVQIKAPKIELSNEEIAKLSDEEFKTLVIRMLTDMVEYGQKIEEKVMSIKSEINKNTQGTHSEGKETRTEINNLDQKEEINIQQVQSEETRIQKKMSRGLGTSRITLNIPLPRSPGSSEKELQRS